MIGYYKKPIACFLLFSLIFMFQSSASLLLGDMHKIKKENSINNSPETGFFEQETIAEYQIKKKIPLIVYIVAGLGIVSVAAFFIFVVIKNYDIRGDWSSHPFEHLYFTGSKHSGTCEAFLRSGNYSVSGKTVSFNLDELYHSEDASFRFSGKFTSETTMSGRYEIYLNNKLTGSGPWEATKIQE